MEAWPSSLDTDTTLPPWRSARIAKACRKQCGLTLLPTTPGGRGEPVDQLTHRASREAVAGDLRRGPVMGPEQWPRLAETAARGGQVGADGGHDVELDGHLAGLAPLAHAHVEAGPAAPIL